MAEASKHYHTIISLVHKYLFHIPYLVNDNYSDKWLFARRHGLLEKLILAILTVFTLPILSCTLASYCLRSLCLLIAPYSGKMQYNLSYN